MHFFYINYTNDYEVSTYAKTITLPEGGAGETAPGPINVSFGETRWTKWPDAFQTNTIQIFNSEFVSQFEIKQFTGVEWYPVIIKNNYNRRLVKITPPTYFWARITGRIKAVPYFTEFVATEKQYPDGSWVEEPRETTKPIVLDPTGCKVLNAPDYQCLQHRIIKDSWDGSDWVRVIPVAIYPTELITQRVADLFKTLKIENATLYPIGKNRGL